MAEAAAELFSFCFSSTVLRIHLLASSSSICFLSDKILSWKGKESEPPISSERKKKTKEIHSIELSVSFLLAKNKPVLKMPIQEK